MSNQSPSLIFALTACLSLVLLSAGSTLAAEAGQTVELPAPTQTGGKPLMEALMDRQSERKFGLAPLTDQQLADVLWAAVGINRPGDNKRTSPTAMNRQDVDVYALTAKGAFRYDALKHALEVVTEGDQTAISGAPLCLVFVTPNDSITSGLNVGYCSQNVYLYAASEGISTVAKTSADRPVLQGLLNLTEEQFVILVQPVGPRP